MREVIAFISIDNTLDRRDIYLRAIRGGALTGSDDTHSDMRMIHLMRSLTVELDLLAADFARRHSLHATDLRALIALLDASRTGILATPGWLGEQLGLNSASTTALIDRLAEVGYASRVRDLVDRRRVLLVVTDEAKALGLTYFGPLFTKLMTAMRAFTPEEQETARRFLESMRDTVTAHHRAESADGATSRP
jgi:DNA-binding MarR family transcriptional regulator